MPTCSFCRKNYKEPRGLTVFTFDSRSLFFCSSKCKRNAKLGRDPKKVKWVKAEIGANELKIKKRKKKKN
jgi:large subunit ribosomal protein L24e